MVSNYLFLFKAKRNYAIIQVFAALYILALANGYLYVWLNDTYIHFDSMENGLAGYSELAKFFFIVIFAPPLETFLLQVIPNVILRKCKIENRYILILIPSVLFGLMHCYHWLYIIQAFFGGLILNYYYLFCKDRTKYAYVIVTMFHLLYNLYGFLFIK